MQAINLALLFKGSEQQKRGLEAIHHERAISIVNGEGMLFRAGTEPSNTSLLGFAPGYPIYLASIYNLLDRNFSTVQPVQNATNSISPVVLFFISGALVSWHVGLVAGLLAAVSHHMSYYSNHLLPDSICALTLLVGVYLLLKASRSRRRSLLLYAIAGLMLGLSLWLRQNVLMLAFFLAVILITIARSKRRVIRGSALFCVVFLLTLAPITIRNYLIYGEFVPVGINLGLVLWEGIGEASGDRFGAVTQDQEVADQEAVIYNNPAYA